MSCSPGAFLMPHSTRCTISQGMPLRARYRPHAIHQGHAVHAAAIGMRAAFSADRPDHASEARMSIAAFTRDGSGRVQV